MRVATLQSYLVHYIALNILVKVFTALQQGNTRMRESKAERDEENKSKRERGEREERERDSDSWVAT